MEVHRRPSPAGYRETARLAPGDELTVAALPDVRLAADRVLG